ncbi:MerR family transcriptional regulator [Lentzea jiangxiensis]|uniref:DNA-binding transcriptional regulator, MerR family n=1 Tax=Lentzea jiangxiensis TaxID=641025 RepID=A0A1H0VTA7_9PSEU|nr:MerR family transcriptional regulator [Lentzea jiangxiensis]SDP81583.1 DNA-binding transcriptional regulator, MerR family [Lentzea jiangxiensis]
MRIGELSRASGVSNRSLRYYESQGLIRSTRSTGGWRDFDPSMIERVVMIQHLLAAGLSSFTISELLPCLDAAPEERTGVMEAVLEQEVHRLEAKRRDIDRELDVLQTLRRDLGESPRADLRESRNSTVEPTGKVDQGSWPAHPTSEER